MEPRLLLPLNWSSELAAFDEDNKGASSSADIVATVVVFIEQFSKEFNWEMELFFLPNAVPSSSPPLLVPATTISSSSPLPRLLPLLSPELVSPARETRFFVPTDFDSETICTVVIDLVVVVGVLFSTKRGRNERPRWRGEGIILLILFALTTLRFGDERMR